MQRNSQNEKKEPKTHKTPKSAKIYQKTATNDRLALKKTINLDFVFVLNRKGCKYMLRNFVMSAVLFMDFMLKIKIRLGSSTNTKSLSFEFST